MLVTKPYRRERAVEYAKRWALDRNPLFVDFTGFGGNCTNFVSQAVLAGSCTMNYTPDFGWYFISAEDRAPAWSSVEYFYDFFTETPSFASKNGGIGPYAREVTREEATLGDVIQYANSMGDWYHTVLITGFDGDEILVSAQSDNALDRPLSSYRNAVQKRFLHIEGVRIEIDDDVCFETLLSGAAMGDETPIEEPPSPEEEDTST
ncbi:MAG: amidase domain-containing protein [Clostridia bacterium]|nr:amidase domain-containing protein [Clostridia bacterium]